MKYFKVRPEEKAAVKDFRYACIKDGIELMLSRNAVASLELIGKRKAGNELEGVTGQALATLSRRGLTRQDSEGEWVITEIGLLVVALAEAGGLLMPKSMTDVK